MSRVDHVSFAWALKQSADIIHEALKHDAKWNRQQARALAEVSAYLDAKGDHLNEKISGEMEEEEFDAECAGDES